MPDNKCAMKKQTYPALKCAIIFFKQGGYFEYSWH